MKQLEKSMFTFNFEKLDVWQKAIRFADAIYKITKKFPEHERFGLTTQMRRAALSTFIIQRSTA
jgi:23S rRNA-intervening sequence protein